MQPGSLPASPTSTCSSVPSPSRGIGTIEREAEVAAVVAIIISVRHVKTVNEPGAPDPDSEEEDGIWLFISAYDDNDNPLEDAKF
jgi:hypothetical protein